MSLVETTAPTPGERLLARLPPFVPLFATGVFVALSGHAVLSLALGYTFTFGGLYRMFLYQQVRPLPYVVLVSAVYAALGSRWLRSGPSALPWRRRLAIVAILVGTLALSAGPGGLIWVYHDMCAGFFPPRDRMIAAFRWGFVEGLKVAPFLVLSVVPMNVISAFVGYRVLMSLATARAARPDQTASTRFS